MKTDLQQELLVTVALALIALADCNGVGARAIGVAHRVGTSTNASLGAIAAAAQSGIQITGPSEGHPNETLTFRLMDGSTQLAVDEWVQARNPDRYVGNDYVTSFALQMIRRGDGTLQLVAPAPGRYRVTARRGSDLWTASVLVRPATVVPAIRGAWFNGMGSLDQQYAASAVTLAKRVGFTWLSIASVGLLDFDSGSREIQAEWCFPESCVHPLADREWLVNEAHRQGLKAVLFLEVVFRTHGKICDPVLECLAQAGISPTDPILLSAWSKYVNQMAEVAQRAGADALMLNGLGLTDEAQRPGWMQLFRDLRNIYSGAVWTTPTQPCPGANGYFPDWGERLGNGLGAGAFDLMASREWCTQSGGSTGLTAEQMYRYVAPRLTTSTFLQHQRQTGLPLIWHGFMNIDVHGINYLRQDPWYNFGPDLVRDDQEVIDYFETLMRATTEQGSSGFLLGLFHDSPPFEGEANAGDPTHQPGLLHAIANWWGGDTDYLARCLVRAPSPPVLFRDDFERGACPLEQVDSLVSGGAIQIIKDPQAATNHVLRLTTGHSGRIPVFGTWTDYTVRLRTRLIGRPTLSAGAVAFRILPQWAGYYELALGFGRLSLLKFPGVKSLGEYSVPGGIAPAKWYDIEANVVGATITVKLGDSQVIQATDSDAPFMNGGIALMTGSGLGDSTTDFDDIVVQDLSPNQGNSRRSRVR
jgi:hypothetical protein